MDDIWGVFGDEGAPVVQPTVTSGVKRVRDACDAVELFTDADGLPIVVPPAPAAPEPQSSTTSSALAIWPNHPPHTTGPIDLAILRGVGGSRGFVASRNVAPGEVLMAEAPILRWPTEERKALPLLRSLFEHQDSAQLVAAMDRLHPECLDHIPSADRQRLAVEHREAIDTLLPLWYEHNKAGRPATAEEGQEVSARCTLLRLCLAIQWNAFETGLFLHQSLFNHASSRKANCDKASRAVDVAGKSITLSVIRATRPIAAGEECVICYLQPPEISHADALHKLRQFDFKPTEDEDTFGFDTVRPYQDDLQPAQLTKPVGNLSTIELEERMIHQIRRVMREPRLSSAALAGAAAIEETIRACGSRHLLVARARRELVEQLRRRLHEAAAAESRGRDADADGQDECTFLLLENAVQLWKTQRRLLGPLHPDVAETLHDIGAALSTLLARAPHRLFKRFPEWCTPALASHAERRANELHSAIAALYSGPCVNSS